MMTKMMTILLAVMLAMTGCGLRNNDPDNPETDAEIIETTETGAAAEKNEGVPADAVVLDLFGFGSPEAR